VTPGADAAELVSPSADELEPKRTKNRKQRRSEISTPTGLALALPLVAMLAQFLIYPIIKFVVLRAKFVDSAIVAMATILMILSTAVVEGAGALRTSMSTP
jgi:hypothetical protein